MTTKSLRIKFNKKFVTLFLIFAATNASAHSKAYAQGVIHQLADVAINTLNNTSSLGTTVAGRPVTTQHSISYGPNSVDQNAVAPPAGATYTRTITSTEWSATSTGPWTAVKPAATIIGDKTSTSKIGGIVTNFSKPGYYKIVLHVDVIWTIGTGNDKWIGEANKTLTQTVVGVDAIQYRQQGDINWIDAPARLNISPGIYQFKAIKTPIGATWPAGEPTWAGSGVNPAATGEITTSNLNQLATYAVTAQGGTTVGITVSVTNNQTTYEYNSAEPMTAGPPPNVSGFSIPYEKTGIKASPDEIVKFNVTANDFDGAHQAGQPVVDGALTLERVMHFVRLKSIV